jgi:hypothetical protein
LICALLFTWGIAHMSSRVAAGMSRIQVYPRRVSDTGTPCDCPFDLTVGRASFEATTVFRWVLALPDHAGNGLVRKNANEQVDRGAG